MFPSPANTLYYTVYVFMRKVSPNYTYVLNSLGTLGLHAKLSSGLFTLDNDNKIVHGTLCD